jgi:predicted transcriptional regulator
MKQALASLTILLFCLGVFHGQIVDPQSKPPAQWLLSIDSRGAPWEKKFQVEINQTGLLLFTEEDRAKIPKDPVTKLTIKLPAGSLHEIYQQALLAAQKVGVKERDDFADGTWMTIKLTSDGNELVASYHLAQTEEEAPNVGKLLALINKHLPQEHHVY